MKKTYISLSSRHLELYIMVNGKKRLVRFTGGSINPPMNGTYSTDDSETIKALDKDSAYGKLFTCQYVIEQASDEKPQNEAPEKEETENSTSEKPEKIKEIPGIKTLQEARDYLLKNIEGLTPSKIPNATAVKNLALKYGLKFPELK